MRIKQGVWTEVRPEEGRDEERGRLEAEERRGEEDEQRER